MDASVSASVTDRLIHSSAKRGKGFPGVVRFRDFDDARNCLSRVASQLLPERVEQIHIRQIDASRHDGRVVDANSFQDVRADHPKSRAEYMDQCISRGLVD